MRRTLCLAWLLLAALPAAAAPVSVTLVTDDLSSQFAIRDGAPTGFQADLLTEALTGAGYRPDFHIRPWVRCFEETRSGAADGLFALYRNSEREQIYLFSNEPLASAEEYLYMRRGQGIDPTRWPELLKGKKVGIVNGTWHGRRFQEAESQHLFASVESVASYESLVEMLGAGRIDAAFANVDTMRDAMGRAASAGRVERVEPAIDTLSIYVAFTRQRDLTPVRDAVDHELRKMKEDGRYEALVRTYLH